MKKLALGLVLALQPWSPLPAGAVSRSQREPGVVVLREWILKDGKVIIRVDSGGCTDKAAIKANVQRGQAPHYAVTFERVRVDDCKAMLFDGVLLEYDLGADLGITGPHTLSVTNSTFQRENAARAEENALKRELVASTMRALEMELRGYEGKLKTAESGVGPAGNVEKFKSRIAELKTGLEDFRRMDPLHYALGTAQEEGPEGFPGEGGHGPLMPPRKRTVAVAVQAAYKQGSILEVEGMSKSGPFYHIAGGGYGSLEPGRRYELTLYCVYEREYFSHIPDYYVHIADVK